MACAFLATFISADAVAFRMTVFMACADAPTVTQYSLTGCNTVSPLVDVQAHRTISQNAYSSQSARNVPHLGENSHERPIVHTAWNARNIADEPDTCLVNVSSIHTLTNPSWCGTACGRNNRELAWAVARVVMNARIPVYLRPEVPLRGEPLLSATEAGCTKGRWDESDAGSGGRARSITAPSLYRGEEPVTRTTLVAEVWSRAKGRKSTRMPVLKERRWRAAAGAQVDALRAAGATVQRVSITGQTSPSSARRWQRRTVHTVAEEDGSTAATPYRERTSPPVVRYAGGDELNEVERVDEGTRTTAASPYCGADEPVVTAQAGGCAGGTGLNKESAYRRRMSQRRLGRRKMSQRTGGTKTPVIEPRERENEPFLRRERRKERSSGLTECRVWLKRGWQAAGGRRRSGAASARGRRVQKGADKTRIAVDSVASATPSPYREGDRPAREPTPGRGSTRV
ncbi:hypothetical protein B0H14DRAFT_3735649 [Mycena olivaceomarginata]|nr:hypothetical protein B0H14DRAFT_3735649 [Mycena olivaceomarginata]